MSLITCMPLYWASCDFKEKFTEMCPFFKIIHDSSKDISVFMRAYAEKYNILSRPRRTLKESYKGDKIVLITPLLKIYGPWVGFHQCLPDDHQGVLDGRALQLVCFKKFGDSATNARFRGYCYARCAVTSETIMLLGNAAYGKNPINNSKHVDKTFMQ